MNSFFVIAQPGFRIVWPDEYKRFVSGLKPRQRLLRLLRSFSVIAQPMATFAKSMIQAP
jgi:hypothetical protein